MRRSGQKLELSSILDASYLQAMHDTFCDDMKAEGIRVASAILDEGAAPMTYEHNHCEFCKEVRRTKQGVQLCTASDMRGIRLASRRLRETGKAEPVYYVCDMGLVDFCSPIVVHKAENGEEETEILAYLFGGQFRCCCEWEGNQLETPEAPTLEKLSEALETKKVGIATTELNEKFAKMQLLKEKEFKKLTHMARSLAFQLNAIVARLYQAKRVEIVEEFMQETMRVQTVDALFDLMAEKLPDIMEAKGCSIFTVQTDEKKCSHLVLRKSTYPDLRRKENSAYYDKGEGLTGWVWKRGRSLRLRNINDKGELAQYGDDLEWKKKHNDSDDHRGFLCVPMMGRTGEVIGVIRMPHKIRKPDRGEGERGFTKYDEIFLNFLAGYVSWAMECQVAQEKSDRMKGLVDIAMSLGVTRRYSEILDHIIMGSVTLFGPSGKKHFLNILESDKRHWKVERVQGTLMLSTEFHDVDGMSFEIDNGLTGLAIHDRRAYISSNLEDSRCSGHYIRAVDAGESAMSAPLMYGEEVYGAISIVSEKKFEFSEEKDVPILRCLAELGASAIWRAKTREARRHKRRYMRRVGRFIRRLVTAIIRLFGG